MNDLGSPVSPSEGVSGPVDASPYFAAGAGVGALVGAKQAAYGDAVTTSAQILAILYPNGIAPASYRDALLITRICDKLGRIATAAGQGDPMGESPYVDIAGYGLLGMMRTERE